jgi:hypothetical protein
VSGRGESVRRPAKAVTQLIKFTRHIQRGSLPSKQTRTEGRRAFRRSPRWGCDRSFVRCRGHGEPKLKPLQGEENHYRENEGIPRCYVRCMRLSIRNRSALGTEAKNIALLIMTSGQYLMPFCLVTYVILPLVASFGRIPRGVSPSLSLAPKVRFRAVEIPFLNGG